MAELQTQTKFFARFKNAYGVTREGLEINNVQEAVDHGIKNRARSFQTYEVTSAILNGKVLTGEPENMSGAHYLQVDKILTAAEIAALCDAKAKEYKTKVQQDQTVYDSAMAAFNASTESWSKKSALLFEPNQKLQNDQRWVRVYEGMQDMFKAEPPSKPYIDAVGGRGGEYSGIKSNDKVYNKQGQQIYPQPSTPAAKAKPGSRP